ncbi:MAG TPA: hypothetical protein VK279_02665 [Solirubrobacteraceae bacterium]|nr:hypothetical protein [Solirubrobacteraceae bacterium]
MPGWIKLAATAILLVSIALAFFGPRPARRASRRRVLAIGVAGLAGYIVGLHAAMAGRTVIAAVLIALAVEAMCLAVWLARAGRDDGGEPRHEDAPDPDAPPDGLDWDEFDRLREDWSRPRLPA